MEVPYQDPKAYGADPRWGFEGKTRKLHGEMCMCSSHMLYMYTSMKKQLPEYLVQLHVILPQWRFYEGANIWISPPP